jgi:hypothetical protein
VLQIEFQSEIERILGQAVCTADYIGQMSDPHYPDKLEVLFGEFRESYQFQGIPESEWPFADYQTLICRTPAFWNTFVQHKLTVECEGVSTYLEHPVTGENPYMQSIELNLEKINRKISKLSR